MCTSPSTKICTATGQLAFGFVNCGSSAKNSRKTFGLTPLMPAPFAACPSHDPDPATCYA
jgi:hypothetical protein